MRRVENSQPELGQLPIADIRLDVKSRDDIPAILIGLQTIYTTPALRDAVFDILREVLPVKRGDNPSAGKVDTDTGRPGMDQWKILVLGTLRLGINTDYDRIQDLANNHNVIRQMLGHSEWADKTQYSLQTIKDNLMLFTPQILDRINQEVVRAGHKLVSKKKSAAGQTATVIGEIPEKLRARCDSFVVETDVHYPTDINLLYDAVRKSIESAAHLANEMSISGWRQYKYHIRQFKQQYRQVQQFKRSNTQDERKKELRELEIILSHGEYVQSARVWLKRAEQTMIEALSKGASVLSTLEIEHYSRYAEIFCDQIILRVVVGEKIPHEEKIFSIFEPHTEWISKGKAGVPQELGLRVCILEDQHRFILHHQVMEKVTDDAVATAMVKAAQEKFPAISLVSFDKGFHSPQNQKELREQLEEVVLPIKGKTTEVQASQTNGETYKKYRRQHSAVESAINGLEHHGLDRCPDHGLNGFKRYVGLSVLSRNIKRLGTIARDRAREEQKRSQAQRKRAA